MSTAPVATRPSATKVWTIIGALYFVWGTTYLGIEKVNETMPTLLGAAIRSLFAGSVLFAWSSLRTRERTTPRQWRAAGIVGVFLLLGGNALVAVSENMGTPTGIVSLIIALIPLWLALFDRVILRSAPLGWRVVAPLYIRPKQAPAFFGISERQVREFMMRGDLKEGLHWFKKGSRMVLLSVQALEEWIKED